MYTDEMVSEDWGNSHYSLLSCNVCQTPILKYTYAQAPWENSSGKVECYTIFTDMSCGGRFLEYSVAADSQI